METAKETQKAIIETVARCGNVKVLKHLQKLTADVVDNNPCDNNQQPYQKLGEYDKAYIRERLTGLTPSQLKVVTNIIDVVIDGKRLEEAEEMAKK